MTFFPFISVSAGSMGQSSTTGRHGANTSTRPGCLSTLGLSCSASGVELLWKRGGKKVVVSSIRPIPRNVKEKLQVERENAQIVLRLLILQHFFQQEMFLCSEHPSYSNS